MITSPSSRNNGDSYWMEQHAQFNQIDTSHNNFIEKEELEKYLDRIYESELSTENAAIKSQLQYLRQQVNPSQINEKTYLQIEP